MRRKPYPVILWIGDTVWKRPEKLPLFFTRLTEMGITAGMVTGDGDAAQAQAHSDALMQGVRELIPHVVVPATKSIMDNLGVPVGPPRPLAKADSDALFERLQRLGVV
jgi:hypothetical protein